MFYSIPLVSGVLLGLLISFGANAQDCKSPPTIEVLAQDHAKIGKITFDQQAIFDTQRPEENHAWQRLANRLHIDTKEVALRAQLLFVEGDAYSPQKLAETERNLRKLPYLRNPQVVPVCYRDGLVDIEVRTRDVWSLTPTLTFNRRGGKNAGAIGIQDYNFLGYGKTLDIERRTTRQRDSTNLLYRDPNLWFSRRTLQVNASTSSDGEALGFKLEQPFYELDAKRQWLIAANRIDLEQSRSLFGEEIDRYQQSRRQLEFSRGWSAGLQNGRTWRYSLGWRFDRNRFARVPGSTLATPESRSASYPFARLESIQDDFDTIINQDQIGRIEDRAFGRNFAVELGYDFRNNQTASVLNANYSDGIRLSEDQSLFLAADGYAWHGRFGKNPKLLNTSLRYFWRQSDQATFYAAAKHTAGTQLFGDEPVVLGGENGLRAYGFDYQYGTKSQLYTLEQRYYTNYQLLGLFQVGGALFFDIGKVSGERAVPAPQFGWLKDVGFGLRLGNSRSARGTAVHIDFAYAMDGRKQDQKFDVIIETRSSF